MVTLLLRGALCAIIISAWLLWAPVAHALTAWRLGIGLQAGYDSQLFQPIVGGYGGGAFTILATPFFELKRETGRVSEILQLTGLFNGSVLVQDALVPLPQGQLMCPSPQVLSGSSCVQSPAGSFLPSGQITGSSSTKIDLSARLKWTLLVSGSAGQTNSFTLALNPAVLDQTALNTQVTSFAAVGAGSTLQWDPTARLKVTQLLNFRAYIPISTTATTQTGTAAAPTALQSYNLDTGVGLDREWARFTLGGELRVGWFDPSQPLTVNAPTPDQSVVTAQAVARSKVEFTPRLQADGQIGVYAATPGANFGKTGVVAPIGGAGLRYIFSGIDLGLSLAYAYSVGGEVFIGQITESHSVTLRGTVPLPREVVLSIGAGYRRSDLLNSDFSSAMGLGYDYALADAGLVWHVRDGVNLLARYEFIYQRTSGTAAVLATNPIPDFDRHILLFGVSLFYPPK